MTGRFIVIEGIDGSGKTTQIKHLAWWLPRSGLMPPNTQLICTREPGGTSLGQCIRQILLHTSAEDSPQSRAELLLYAADRAQHVDTLILPALQRGDWVLSDRFSGSTLAYQGYGRGVDRALIADLDRISTYGLQPDITVCLSLPVAESILRRQGTTQDRMEAEGRDFLEKVAAGFHELAQQSHWCFVQASGLPMEVSSALERCLKERLG